MAVKMKGKGNKVQNNLKENSIGQGVNVYKNCKMKKLF